MIDLAALKAAAEAATPGRWSIDGPWWHGDDAVSLISAGDQRTAVAIEPPWGHTSHGPEDMQFIALANPETVKALVAVVEAAQEMIELLVNIEGEADTVPAFDNLANALAPFRNES